MITTLRNICQGGIYDHLGGGFARYSTDERWLAPHFEKMLYDNALLVDLLTEVWRETQDPLFKVRIAETVDWLLREMVAEGGGFAASYDADSEGEEGKFYVWSAAEIEKLLGPEDAAFFARVYDVSPAGNWEGHSILNRLGAMVMLSDDDEHRLAGMRTKLVKAREGRVHPGWDDKVLADWNGLMIAALARAAQVFDRPDWLAAAERAFAFVETSMTRERPPAACVSPRSGYSSGHRKRLRQHDLGGATPLPGHARDTYLAAARAWTDVLDRHYWIADPGGYATTADDTADVIVRLHSSTDDATPNANAIMVSNLAALSVLTGDAAYADRAGAILRGFSGDLAQNLIAHAGLLAGAMDFIAPQLVVLVNAASNGTDDLAAVLERHSLPGALEFRLEGASIGLQAPALAGKSAIDGKSTGYLCIGPQCSPPVCDAVALQAALKRQRIGL